MFDKKCVLSGDDLSLFIIWVKVLRDQYRTDGIKCLERKCPDYYVRVESEFSEHVPLSPSHDILNIEIDICGEFYLELSTWNNILVTNYTGITSLVSNWTNVFAGKNPFSPNVCFEVFKLLVEET